MKRVVELELWSAPGKMPAPPDGKAIAMACCHATSLQGDVVLGLSFVPDEIDVAHLASLLESGEASIREFARFCSHQDLPIKADNTDSAARFVAFVEGSPLAWLHFPDSEEGKDMALLVHRWAKHAGHLIRAGQGEPELSESQVLALWDGGARSVNRARVPHPDGEALGTKDRSSRWSEP